MGSCQQQSDFSLLFGQSILSASPALLFSILAGLRTWSLIRREHRVQNRAALVAKQILIFALWVTHIVLVVLWSRKSSIRTPMSLPMAAVYLLATTVTAPLSWLEHTKTIKPSPLICSYFILSVLLDTTQIRTLWTRVDDDRTLVAVFTASYSLRAIILLMESLPKNLTRGADISRSPEDKCGVISRSLFLWMIPLLYKGYKQSLGVNDLYAPPIDAAPENLEEKLWRGWSNCKFTSLSYKKGGIAATNLVILDSSSQPRCQKQITIRYCESPLATITRSDHSKTLRCGLHACSASTSITSCSIP